ncbi:LysM peptidoglycan-binding domain-containing protein [Nocardioides sp.]|uniref:LysM peptidoglycan-binding domain-containing protein n=1 Tax=Nocardioides sp. TaxID=35761 RepID=UPI0035289CE4
MRTWRVAPTWLGVTAVVGLLPWLLAPDLGLVARGTSDLTSMLRAGSAVALLGCGAWWWAATTAVLLGAARGRVSRPRGCPQWLHRLLLAALGASLTAGLATPALGADDLARPQQSRVAQTADPLHGLPFPDRAEGLPAAGRPAPSTSPARDVAASAVQPRGALTHDAAGTHRVGPGDTLWTIAARDLPPDATEAEIGAAWRRIYRLNRVAIGDDPDLLLPGIVLVLPSTERSR